MRSSQKSLSKDLGNSNMKSTSLIGEENSCVGDLILSRSMFLFNKESFN